MRIISGQLKSRIFNSPKGHKTHPMGEKVRGGLFNTLGDITNLNVLDAFSGSGALSFEAISRGASFVTAIDNDKSAQNTIEHNTELLDLHDKIKLVKANAGAWASTNDQHFDLVLLDPPYDQVNEKLLKALSLKAKQDGGIIVISLPPNEKADIEGTDLITTKDYGDATLYFYKRIK